MRKIEIAHTYDYKHGWTILTEYKAYDQDVWGWFWSIYYDEGEYETSLCELSLLPEMRSMFGPFSTEEEAQSVAYRFWEKVMVDHDLWERLLSIDLENWVKLMKSTGNYSDVLGGSAL